MAQPVKRRREGRSGRDRPAAAPELPAITKVVGWSWTKGRSKRLLLEVESAGRRIALQISLPAALAIEEAIRNAWVADYFF